MLVLLSPAKKLDFDSPVRTRLHTQPLFVEQAAALIEVLKKKNPQEISALMNISAALAELNVERYADWVPEFNLDNARQAILAFNGDVYDGLDAPSLSDARLKWAQEHLVILSGLYGALRPLDLMQPYRLEMGTRLETARGPNLYAYWGMRIRDYLNERLASVRKPVVLNLASDEYFKSVRAQELEAAVVQCVFQDYSKGAWKVISFYAKKARGRMARFVIENRISDPAALQAFDEDGYAYASAESSDTRMVFRREQAPGR